MYHRVLNLVDAWHCMIYTQPAVLLVYSVFLILIHQPALSCRKGETERPTVFTFLSHQDCGAY